MNKKNGLSRYRQEKVMWAFCADLTASQAAVMLRLSRTTVNRYYGLFRAAVARHQKALKDMLVGTVEVDEQGLVAAGVPTGAGREDEPITALEGVGELALEIAQHRLDAQGVEEGALCGVAQHGAHGEPLLGGLPAQEPADLPVGTDDEDLHEASA